VDKYGYCQNSAFSAIGYKEIIQYLQGVCTLDVAIEQIKLNTRHYAKRQISYFKRMQITRYIDVEGKTPFEIASEIANCIK
jgi:tRNA dimethylallyltransferase